MASPDTTVFYKQSGERLNKGEGKNPFWKPGGVRSVQNKLALAYRSREELGIKGINVVSGAGNIIRGEGLKDEGIAPEYADALGRWATAMNTVVIQAALESKKIPTKSFIAPGMRLEDPKFHFEEYSPEALAEAHEAGFLTLVAGGIGEDNITTDGATVWYAQRHHELMGEEDGAVTILKGTQVDGVFDADPNAPDTVNARRYSVIGAPEMQRYHKRLGVIDEPSLAMLIESGLSMTVFSEGGHDLYTLLRFRGENGASEMGVDIGTLVVGREVVAQFADAA
jgi:uridylate kinase